MGKKNRHTVMLEDTVWDWAAEFGEDVGEDRSEIINRAVKVYAGKLASGDWKDPKFKDKYDKQIEALVRNR